MNSKVLPWIGILIVIILFVFQQRQSDKKLQDEKAKVSTYLLQIQSLQDSIKNKDGKIVKLQEAIVFEGERGKRELSKFTDSVFNLRKKDEKKYKETVAYYENYISTYLPQYVYIPYIDSNNHVGKDTAEYLRNSVRVPREFEQKNSYFNIKGTVLKSGVQIDSMNLPDTLKGRFVEKKGGLFKKNTIEYQVVNTNPYIRINGGKSAVYVPEKKRLLPKAIALVILGIITGLILK